LKTIAAVLVLALMTTSAVECFGESNVKPEQKIAGQIRKISNHKDPRVTLVLRSGEKVKGRLGDVGESSFALISTVDNSSHTYNYADVISVHGKGMSTGAKIGIGAVGVIVAIAVFSIIMVRSIGPM
jgi:small nuclear ribonucleoprotein (snRNP)-like protein